VVGRVHLHLEKWGNFSIVLLQNMLSGVEEGRFFARIELPSLKANRPGSAGGGGGCSKAEVDWGWLKG